MTVVNLLSIQVALRDRIPRTSQRLTNPNANRFIEKSKTAGSVFLNNGAISQSSPLDSVLCTMRQDYGGAALRPIGPIRNKGPSITRLGRH